MRILLVHNFYQSSSPSGEDNVFENEAGMLRRAGHKVTTYIKKNDDLLGSTKLELLKVGINTSWSRNSYNLLLQQLRTDKPDIVHIHNTFPQISPSVYAACYDCGIPVVQTLHNYRLICAGAMLYRNGKSCEKCIPRRHSYGLLHRCYRNSFLQTAAVTRMLKYNWANDTYNKYITRYIALSNFATDRFVSGGLLRNKINVKPNFLPSPPSAGEGGKSAIFVGRLSSEKGVHTLLSAWESVKQHKLVIIGDGPLMGELKTIACDKSLNVEFAGFCTKEEVYARVRNSLVQIVPSETYEGFPMVILEAYACGTPVLASKIGSLDELIHEGKTGYKFEPGNADDLADKLKLIFADIDNPARLRHNIRKHFEENYTEASNLKMLENIYGISL